MWAETTQQLVAAGAYQANGDDVHALIYAPRQVRFVVLEGFQ